MHGGKFVVGCKPVRIEVISRVLIGGEIENIHVFWNNNNAARMLTCGAFNALAHIGDLGDLGGWNLGWIDTLPFVISSDESESNLLRDGFNGASAEAVFSA